nr:hypothetical protein [Kibdelosporangium sp. MJ126-NF4]
METLKAWSEGQRYPLLADVLGGSGRCEVEQLVSAVLDGIASPLVEPAVAVTRHVAVGRFQLARDVLNDSTATDALTEDERTALFSTVDRAERDAVLQLDRRRNELVQRAERAEMQADPPFDLPVGPHQGFAEATAVLDSWEREIVEGEDKLIASLRDLVDPDTAPEWAEALHTALEAKEFPAAKEIITKGPGGFEAGPTAVVQIGSWPWPEVPVTEVLTWYADAVRGNRPFNERWRPARDDVAATELIDAIGALCDAVDATTVSRFAAAVDGLLELSGVAHVVHQEDGGFRTNLRGLLDPRLPLSLLPRAMPLWVGPPGWSPPSGRPAVWFQLSRAAVSPPSGVAALRPDTLFEMIASESTHRRTVAARRIHLLRTICRQLELADLVDPDPRIDLGKTTQLRTDVAWLFDLLGVRVDGAVLDTVLYDTSGHPVALRGVLEFLIGERGRRPIQVTMDDVARWRADQRGLEKLCDRIKDGLDNAGVAVLALLLRDDADALGRDFRPDDLMYQLPDDAHSTDGSAGAATLTELLDVSSALRSLVAEGLVTPGKTNAYQFPRAGAARPAPWQLGLG